MRRSHAATVVGPARQRLISVSIRGHKGKSERGGRKSGDNSGQEANCRAEMVSEQRKARQFAACPEFCVCRSKLRRCSGTPRPDGRLAGIRMAYLRRWASLPRSGVGARRSAGFERILRLAALAFPMAQDAVGDPRVCLVQGSFFRMTRPIRRMRIAHQKAGLWRKGIVQLPLGNTTSRMLWRVSKVMAADLVRPRGRKRSNCRRAIRAEFSRWGQAERVYRPGVPGPDSRRRLALHPRRSRACLAEARDASHVEMPLRAVRSTPGI